MLPISKDSLNGEDAMKLQVTFGDFAEIGSAASDVSEELTEAFHLGKSSTMLMRGCRAC